MIFKHFRWKSSCSNRIRTNRAGVGRDHHPVDGVAPFLWADGHQDQGQGQGRALARVGRRLPPRHVGDGAGSQTNEGEDGQDGEGHGAAHWLFRSWYVFKIPNLLDNFLLEVASWPYQYFKVVLNWERFLKLFKVPKQL